MEEFVDYFRAKEFSRSHFILFYTPFRVIYSSFPSIQLSFYLHPSCSLSLSFPSSYGVYCGDNVSFPHDSFPNCSHLSTQPAAPSRTHCINKLHWGLISQHSDASGQHAHTSTLLGMTISDCSRMLRLKVNNFTRADIHSAVFREMQIVGEIANDKVFVEAKNTKIMKLSDRG